MIKMNKELWDICKNKSYLDDVRISQLHSYLVRALEQSSGDVAELGVLKGGTSKYLSNIAKDRQIHIFDTFNGLPKYYISPLDGDMTEESFADTHVDVVQRYLSDCNNVRIYKGILPMALDNLEPKNFSFVFIDCVLYFSVYGSLLYFSDKIDKNGFIIVDDYGRDETPGVKIAVEMFLKKYPNFNILELEDYMLLIYKGSLQMQDFKEMWKDLKPHTCVGTTRAKSIFQTIQKLKNRNIKGSLAELGVFRGGITRMMAMLCPTSIVHAFDTFEGMPPLHTPYDMPKDSDNFKCGNFNDLDFTQIQKDFSACGNIEIHKGIFPETATGIENESFMFCHLDFDLYNSCLEAMEFFYPLLVDGGVIIIDDYDRPECPGVKKAINEYCSKVNVDVDVLKDFQALVRK